MFPEHLRTFDYLGPRQYFLTFCTHNRDRHFVNAEAVAVVRTQIARACGEQRMPLIAYCFMPDHLHLLVEGQSEDSDCKQFIARAKQYSGFYYRRAFGRPLWQRYGYEHVLRDDQAAVSVARYILENPVRARIVATPQDYPFSGSSMHALEELLDAVQLRKRWYTRGG
jgi:putative transposase